MTCRKIFAGVVLAGLISGAPAKADPVSDFLNAIFQPRHEVGVVKSSKSARLHKPEIHWRGRSPFHAMKVMGVAQSEGARSWVASFYGGGPKKYEPNSHTANGEYFDQWGLTAAHRTLPFGTRLNVCYRGCVTVRVNDRGPALWTGRSLDLSRGAASAIGMINAGEAAVRVSVLR
jgi:rare lipoprotein A